MEDRYLKLLEFNKILEIIENLSITYIGKDLSKNLVPYSTKQEAEKALKQTNEASILIYRKGNVPIYDIKDITIHIKKLESSQFLNAEQLRDLAAILRCSRLLKEYYSSEEIDMSEFESLEGIFNNLYSNQNIESTIYTNIVDDNTILDTASKNLSQIRKNIRTKEQEIKNKLQSLLHSKYVQEPIVTFRNGRYVLPVKNEYRSEIKGFIHDMSQSGSTVFIEPLSVFDLNNDLNNLKNEEQVEIEVILQKFTSLFFDIIDNIKNNVNLIGLIDFTFAKAKYSNSIDGTKPILTDKKELKLLNAYHPLLNKETAVRNSIIIGDEYKSLIITGPNTGGKTVVLKTAGILTLMAESGLNIPAKEGSSLYFFDKVYADIGDEQSITSSLSTFSSHMSNISNIINHATKDSLILLDELGSGTDPIEGAALGISILDYLKREDILTLSTTHYPEIKKFALTTEGFKNASVEFNVETLSPTYKLLIGVPGTSNAFSISSKLGISDNIILRAKDFISNENINIEELLNNIYKEKRLIEEEKEQIDLNYQKSKEIKESYEEKLSSLNLKEKDIIGKAKKQAQNILLEAKDDANQIIKELESSKTSSKDANKLRNKLNDKIDKLGIKDSKVEPINKIENIEDISVGQEVFVTSINQNATILSIKDESSILVQLPLGKSSFKLEDLELVKVSSKKEIPINKNKSEFIPKQISSEINVLGYTVEEAIHEIDKYIDTCFVAHLKTIRIIHGKGTGALRKGIQEYLKTNPHVDSFRNGTFAEGEMGVTVVTLK